MWNTQPCIASSILLINMHQNCREYYQNKHSISVLSFHMLAKIGHEFILLTQLSVYRKYRPDVPSYKQNYKAWWQFAYRCMLDEVRRRRNNWDWTHMLEHRQLCKNYATVYQCKLTNRGKVNSEQLCILEKAEKTLDLLNLVVIRQRIEMEVCW